MTEGKSRTAGTRAPPTTQPNSAASNITLSRRSPAARLRARPSQRVLRVVAQWLAPRMPE